MANFMSELRKWICLTSVTLAVSTFIAFEPQTAEAQDFETPPARKGRAVASRMNVPAPLSPHVGAQLTTAFSNRYGPDALGILTVSALTPQQLVLSYDSTRGLHVPRLIRAEDRERSNAYVLGYAAGMPFNIPDTTSLGISGATLVQLRTTGTTKLTLVYDEKLSRIEGELRLVAKDVKFPILIEDQVRIVSAVHAFGTFGSGERRGSGDFYFLDNKNDPLMLQSTIQFSWEKDPRTERVIRVTAGASMRSAMEQALRSTRLYAIYGLHFAFDKAELKPESAALVKDIATTLRNNPAWTLEVTGHTDSIGDPAYNFKLSADRADSVVAALVASGIAPERLKALGAGETMPKGDNGTLEGRALNRRVELRRTDR